MTTVLARSERRLWARFAPRPLPWQKERSMLLSKLKTAVLMTAAFAGSGVGLLTFSAPWAGREGTASARACLLSSDGTGTTVRAGDSQQAVKVYRLKLAGAEHVADLLRSLFIVVNAQDPYVRFYFDVETNSLMVGASGQHQRQIGWVLALLDRSNKEPAQAVERGDSEKRVKGYPIKHADGEAAAAVLRSLFLVVNHRVGYARFAFDARTGVLIAVASPKHHKQIARVLEVLDAQTRPAKEAAKADDAEPQVQVFPIKYLDGEQLIAKLRSQFVVVNHQQAEARFGFDDRTHSLIVIAAGNLRAKIRDCIAVFDQSQQR
jgi:hypothetical protein